MEISVITWAHRPLGFVRYQRAWPFIWAGLSPWVNGLLGAGEKAGPFEHDSRNSNVSKYRLLHESIAHWVLGVIKGRGHLLGRACPYELMNAFAHSLTHSPT